MLHDRRGIAIATLIVGAVTAPGCSAVNPFESRVTTVQSQERPADANDADVEFLTDMTQHLRRGRALTSAAIDPSANARDRVAILARRIQDDDAVRVVKMIDVLQGWGEASIAFTPAGEASMLVDLVGIEFDEQWAVLMVAHHAEAAVLAEQVKRDGSSRDVNNLATGMLVDLGFETSTIESI